MPIIKTCVYLRDVQYYQNDAKQMNLKQKILVSFIGFVIIFTIMNLNNKTSDFFKNDAELFYDYFLPIQMNKEKFLGEISDSSNHMYPYYRFEKNCLPKIDQWNGKFKIGNKITKKRGSLNLIIEEDGVNKVLYFETKNFEGSALPCECEKILKN